MTFSLDISPAMKEKCDILDISEEEQQNLIGQRMQEIIQLLGLDEV